MGRKFLRSFEWEKGKGLLDGLLSVVVVMGKYDETRTQFRYSEKIYL